MLSVTDDLTPPAATARDVAHSVVRALVSEVPGGAAAVELVNSVLAPPLERRRNEWMERVAEVLRTLQREHGSNLEELRTNAAFVDTVLQATQISLRTSQQAKL